MSADRRARRRAALLVTVLAIVAACGAAGGPKARVTVPQGATLRVAAESLARAGVIRMPALFRLYAKLRGHERSIKAGTYLLPRNSGYGSALEALQGGKGLVHVVTIPEGFALSQIVPLVASRLGVPRDSVDAATRDTALLHRLDVPTRTLEGYLFPDTYVFTEGTTARSAVQTMVRRFEQIWKPEWTARLDSLTLSRHDVMALASIVEKEARLPEERPVIAAVYMNRLRTGMLLQADPTVQYALGQHQARVLYKHLEVESPYNTYRNKGLPPGPIASPGAASIRAALYPANVPWVYFVAFPDGHHEFRRDVAGHDDARAAARVAWDAYDLARGAQRAPASRDSTPTAAPVRRPAR